MISALLPTIIAGLLIASIGIFSAHQKDLQDAQQEQQIDLPDDITQTDNKK